MSAALTRRGALRGAAAAAIGLAAGVAPVLALALSTDDRHLIELADEMWAIHHAAEAFTVAHRGRETDETEDAFHEIISRYCPAEEELAETPAASMVGVMAKAHACQVPTLRDIDGGPVALSLADDVWRLFGGAP